MNEDFQKKIEEALRDPLVTLPKFLVEEGVIGASELEEMLREISVGILEQTHHALKAAPPAPSGPRPELPKLVERPE